MSTDFVLLGPIRLLQIGNLNGPFTPPRASEVALTTHACSPLLFEQMLGYANHLGLYAEQNGKSVEALGNFPQAFTHLALISAALNLDRTTRLPVSPQQPAHS